MLVLTRKPGEQIIIANNIRLTVVSIGHGRVKIGIEAPSDVTIDRQEIHDRKQAEDVTPAVPTVVEPPAPVALHNRIVGRLPQPTPAPRPLYRNKPR